jgi:hypothetical protein
MGNGSVKGVRSRSPILKDDKNFDGIIVGEENYDQPPLQHEVQLGVHIIWDRGGASGVAGVMGG